MEFTTREAALLATARKNPLSQERSGMIMLIAGGIMLAAALAEAYPFDSAAGWSRVSQGLLWLMLGTLVWQHQRFQAAAYSLIAKLDGSYADRVPPQPSALGLGPTAAGSHQDRR